MRIEIRSFDGEATDSLTGYAARQFYLALRPFVGHVRAVTVQLGKTQSTHPTAAGRCRATVDLHPSRRLGVEASGAQPYLVVNQVADAARGAVTTALTGGTRERVLWTPSAPMWMSARTSGRERRQD